ncbi:putative pyruvate, phosphate dikinase regulatory protein [Novipirellula aureliae]|uniref:Putative pyruvate, phosphate dikinase regulatory protein n=1 Tax=Novipirellula aureliae TaxID=2527966 RepID=A0A5C6DGI1_9BACT|nr:kinase/pyrophosphorylase [Novipirellula aureliae]TWU34186.1 putative pyruvate, phosphate dikinase regulatory protein [Novipirellula aureliae]
MKKSTKANQSNGKKSVTLHLISAATGSLANQVIYSAIAQFPHLTTKIVTHTFIDSAEQIDAILKKASGSDCWIFHALLNPELTQLVRVRCQDRGIPEYSLTDTVIRFVADASNCEPAFEPANRLDEEYFRRLDTLEFTLQHDDSRRLETVGEADIILIGLSRVSKTPTSIVLGELGFKVANVSIAIESGIPEEIKKSYRDKTVALTIQPKRLYEIRSRRMSINKFDKAIRKASPVEHRYTDLKSIIREVMEAEQIYRQRKYKMVDITDQPIEATVVRVLEALGLDRPKG